MVRGSCVARPRRGRYDGRHITRRNSADDEADLFRRFHASDGCFAPAVDLSLPAAIINASPGTESGR
jgi:hypothetical protein